VTPRFVRPIHVLIADNQPIVRLGLRTLLSSEPDMELVGETADGDSAVAQAEALRPDVLLLGLQMPGKSGAQVIEALAESAPTVRALVLTMFADDEHIFSAFRAGAHGYLLKESSLDDVSQGVRDVVTGKSPMHPDIARRVLRGLVQTSPTAAQKTLTRRETDVLTLVAKGLPNKTIARQLSLSDRTVRSHVSHILERLQVTSRTQAALYALRVGLARSEDEAQG
jgi:DNA-binding NarL/FixJ family response regulator